LERSLGKREILEQYFNRAYYGNGAVGSGGRSQRYFGKSAATLGQARRSSGGLAARSRGYDPLVHRNAAMVRRTHVLDLMVQRGFLSSEKRQRIEREPIALH